MDPSTKDEKKHDETLTHNSPGEQKKDNAKKPKDSTNNTPDELQHQVALTVESQALYSVRNVMYKVM